MTHSDDNFDNDATFTTNPQQTFSKRRRLSPEETRHLNAVFEVTPKPDSTLREKLAAELDTSPRVIQIWFQNKRAKLKRDLADEGTPNLLFSATKPRNPTSPEEVSYLVETALKARNQKTKQVSDEHFNIDFSTNDQCKESFVNMPTLREESYSPQFTKISVEPLLSPLSDSNDTMSLSCWPITDSTPIFDDILLQDPSLLLPPTLPNPKLDNEQGGLFDQNPYTMYLFNSEHSDLLFTLKTGISF